MPHTFGKNLPKYWDKDTEIYYTKRLISPNYVSNKIALTKFHCINSTIFTNNSFYQNQNT